MAAIALSALALLEVHSEVFSLQPFLVEDQKCLLLPTQDSALASADVPAPSAQTPRLSLNTFNFRVWGLWDRRTELG